MRTKEILRDRDDESERENKMMMTSSESLEEVQDCYKCTMANRA